MGVSGGVSFSENSLQIILKITDFNFYSAYKLIIDPLSKSMLNLYIAAAYITNNIIM